MKRLPIIPLIILLIVGGMALKTALPTWLVSLKTPVDFNTLAVEDVRSGLRVEGNVYVVVDTFAVEESWTEHSNGSVTPKETSKYYYIVPIGPAAFSCVGLEIPDEDAAVYADLADATWDYLTGETDALNAAPIPFEGYIAPMDEELYSLFVEWFQDTGYFGTSDAAEVRTYALPYLLTTYSTSGTYLVLGIGLAALLAALLMVLSHLRYRKRQRQAGAAEEEPLPPNSPGRVEGGLERG